MIRHKYLTEPKCIDAAIAHYDFTSLIPNRLGEYAEKDINTLLGQHQRVTETISKQIVSLGQTRQGVMIFAATVQHANEIFGHLPQDKAALITGDTPSQQRDLLIQAFKAKELKFLVNVSVLTTGFDAPHVDLIAILRPTQSVSLYQQIVGRGLRLSDNKTECLVIDYAGNDFNLHHPEVGEKKPNPDTKPVQVFCPGCGFANIFWGKTDESGKVTEHFGRRCKGLLESDDESQKPEQCDYRFRFKECPHCQAENDIAARYCHQCSGVIIDPDDQLKNALNLKDALVLRCAGIHLENDNERLKVTYHGEDGEELNESFDFSKPAAKKAFNQLYGKRVANSQKPTVFTTISEVLAVEQLLTAPDFVIARKQKYYWRIQERIFDYEGQYRKANHL